MPKKEEPLSGLQKFLPAGTLEPVIVYLQQYNVHLTVARERKSILGDYRHKTHHSNHRISVNGNLNQYAFLITLLHELAHLLTFEKWGNRVSSHGREWKQVFGELLAQFIQHNVFPADIKNALLQSLHNPAASSCADEVLLRTLKNYDAKKDGLVFVEQIPQGALFTTSDRRVFRKGARQRKRYKCEEIRTKKFYLFSAVYEVMELLPEVSEMFLANDKALTEEETKHKKTNQLMAIEQMPDGALFITHDGLVFRKGEKLRKRYKCEDVETKKQYLVSGLYEAKLKNPQTP